jgi:N-methylhydantoinase A
MTRLAVEIGGTFTDVIWEAGGERLRTQKIPSTPADLARAGLLVTRGFRDLLAIQRQLRENVYDPFPCKPEPLIPSRLTREVGGGWGAMYLIRPDSAGAGEFRGGHWARRV